MRPKRWLRRLLLAAALAAACAPQGDERARDPLGTVMKPVVSLRDPGDFHAYGEGARAVGPPGMGITVDDGGLTLSLPAAKRDESATLALRVTTTHVRGAPLDRGTLGWEGARAQLERGNVDEWFVSGPEGVEHGYLIHQRPQGAGALTLDVSMTGLTARLRSDRLAELHDERGRVRVHYRDPHAEDANGRPLPIVMRAAPGGVSLEVDDRDARYPLLIDPTFALTGPLYPSMPAPLGDFGAAVAVEGRWAIVTATGEAGGGGLYVFDLFADPSQPSQRFAFGSGSNGRLAIDGDVFVLGAWSLSTVGRAEIYRESAGQWQSELTLDPPGSSDDFGAAVALEGTTLAVGAPADDSVANNAGKVYVYAHDGTTWALTAELTRPGGVANDRFGSSVQLSGDHLIVGASRVDTSHSDAGEIYVFARDGSGWEATPSQTLNTPSAVQRNNTHLGFVTAVDGDLLVATNEQPVGTSGTEAPSELLVWERAGDVWGTPIVIEQAGVFEDDRFGAALAVAGGRIVAGAYAADSVGRAFVYEQVNAAWETVQTLDNPITPRNNDYFGAALAIDALGMLLVADPRDNNGATDAGAVYLFPLVGSPCADASSCASQHCADGVCCDEACGPCGACDLSGSEGHCDPFPADTEVATCGAVLCNGFEAICPDCVDDDDCVTGHFCDAPTCIALKADGAPCGDDDECVSEHCVDGVCCNDACGAQCHACDVPTSLGTCTPVSGQPHGDRPPCPGNTCVGDALHHQFACLGGDSCVPQVADCGGYTCADGACLDTCDVNADCAAGFACADEVGECQATEAVCDDTILTFGDGTTLDCHPYRCDDGGCVASCTTAELCATGFVCDASGACVAPPTAISGGCGLATTRGDGRAALSIVALLGLAITSRRRATGYLRRRRGAV